MPMLPEIGTQEIQLKTNCQQKPRHSSYILYSSILIEWKSMLQQEIALFSTELGTMGLLYALQKAIPIVHIFKKMKEIGFQVNTKKTMQVFKKQHQSNQNSQVP
jgi:hypothetical protein